MWAFEVALLLKRRPERWARVDVVSALRASELIVSQSFDNLTVAGLLAVDSEGYVAYAPASAATAELMDSAEVLYDSKPNQVRRLIVAREELGLTAFANAFRIRDV